MLTNWKTTLAGILTIATFGGKIVLNEGRNVSSEDIAGIIAGIGLLFAKDSNVTHATAATQGEPKAASKT